MKSEKEAAKKQELKKLQQEQKLEEEPLVRVAGKYTYVYWDGWRREENVAIDRVFHVV